MARLSVPLSETICRCVVARTLQNAYRAQQAAAMDHVRQTLFFSCFVAGACFSQYDLSAGSVAPREEKMGGRIIQGGRRRLIVSCRSLLKLERS